MKRTSTIILAFIASFVISVIITTLIRLDIESDINEGEKITVTRIDSRYTVWDVNYKNHWFLYSDVGLIHAPYCSCQNKTE